MRGVAAALLLTISAFAPLTAQAATESDRRDYALSACLIRQTASRELQAEGYHLADVVIARAGIDPFVWKPLANAVDATLARRGLLMVHVDGPVAQATRPAPLASCLGVIDDPAVRRVMARLAIKGKR